MNRGQRSRFQSGGFIRRTPNRLLPGGASQTIPAHLSRIIVLG